MSEPKPGKGPTKLAELKKLLVLFYILLLNTHQNLYKEGDC